MPSTILNWKKQTKRPRHLAGEISAMYIGPTTEDAPTARPPMKRKNIKAYQLTMAPLKTAEIRYRMPMTMSERLRPYFSAGFPQNSAPMIVPIRAVAIVKPWAKSLSP